MIRVATFNLNNLFDRFNFHAAIDERATVNAIYRWHLSRNRDLLPPPVVLPPLDNDGTPIIDGRGPVRIELSPQGRLVMPKPATQLEALLNRVDRLNADVLAVQEIENIAALREFNSQLDAPYPYVVVIEGNDPRFIDVGVLSRYPIGNAISHRWVPDPASPNRFLFSRDLLAVSIMNQSRDQTLFTIWVGHLKSKFVDPEITDPNEIAAANQRNDERRTRQAQAMHDIIEAHHGANDPYIICGDLNDHPTNDPLTPLLRGNLNIRDVFHNGVTIVYERPEGEGPRIGNPEDQPANEDWTHRYRVSNGPDDYERFDQMLLSQSLQQHQDQAAIQRRTHWSKNQAGTDHDPVFVDLDLNPLA